MRVFEMGRASDAGAMRVLLGAAAAGAVAIMVYGVQVSSPAEFFSVASTGLLIGAAAFAVGGLTGFLFGIPRAVGDQKENERRSTDDGEDAGSTRGYRPSTNLEDISDWLTKILLGAGLTQLGAIARGFQGLGSTMAPAFGGLPSSEVFAMAATVYFSVAGFLTSFLWARLNLGRLLTRADIESEREAARRQGQAEAAVQLAGSVAMQGKPEPTGNRGMWVDDMPENNVHEREMLTRVLGVVIDTALSTEEAIKRLGDGYVFVITDLARPGDRRAGFTLLDMVSRSHPNLPVIIYTSSERHNAEAFRRGAIGSTGSPLKLLEMVRSVTSRRPSQNS